MSLVSLVKRITLCINFVYLLNNRQNPLNKDFYKGYLFLVHKFYFRIKQTHLTVQEANQFDKTSYKKN